MQNYRVKVRGETYLWGGSLIEKKFEPQSPVYIHFRVDETGEQIKLARKQDQNSSLEQLGFLNPGESFTIQLRGLVGVIASTVDPVDTYVECSLLTAPRES
jgi:hypothetical protein